MPSNPMKIGVQSLRQSPHHSAAVNSHELPACCDENKLKQTSRRKGCTGTCRKDNDSEPQNKTKVP